MLDMFIIFILNNKDIGFPHTRMMRCRMHTEPYKVMNGLLIPVLSEIARFRIKDKSENTFINM